MCAFMFEASIANLHISTGPSLSFPKAADNHHLFKAPLSLAHTVSVCVGEDEETLTDREEGPLAD